MNYAQANEMLQGRNKDRRKLANNTYLERRGQNIAVKLHATDVITFEPSGCFSLNSGGWKTKTTKNRINRFSPNQIMQKSGLWYIGGKIFADGFQFGPDGTLLTKLEDPKKVEFKKRKIDRLVRKYINGFVAHIAAGKLEDPSGGDCWGCCMITAEGKNDSVTGMDHYFSHFSEKYFVPSMLMQAIIEQGYLKPGIIWAQIKENGKIGREDSFAKRALQRYFRSRKDKLIASIQL